MNITMRFESMDAIPDADFCSLCLGLEQIATGRDGELFAQLADLLLKTVLLAELDRRVDGIGPQIHQLGIDMTADADSLRWITRTTQRMRDHLQQAGKPSSAEVFDIITQSFNTEIQRVSAAKEADIAELTRLYEL